jgi:hypothetical protein
MMLIVCLGLIAKITLVSAQCNVGIQNVNHFNWNKVGVSVLIQLLKQAAF